MIDTYKPIHQNRMMSLNKLTLTQLLLLHDIPHHLWNLSYSSPEQQKRCHKGCKKTYNTKDSLVVTDPTTSLALTGLSMGERTGSRVLQQVWSYVLELAGRRHNVGRGGASE
jgi:hypothetical protein